MIKNVQENLNHVDCGTLKYPGCQNLFFKTDAFFFFCVSKYKQQLFWKYHQGTKIKFKLYPIGHEKVKLKIKSEFVFIWVSYWAQPCTHVKCD